MADPQHVSARTNDAGPCAEALLGLRASPPAARLPGVTALDAVAQAAMVGSSAPNTVFLVPPKRARGQRLARLQSANPIGDHDPRHDKRTQPTQNCHQLEFPVHAHHAHGASLPLYSASTAFASISEWAPPPQQTLPSLQTLASTAYEAHPTLHPSGWAVSPGFPLQQASQHLQPPTRTAPSQLQHLSWNQHNSQNYGYASVGSAPDLHPSMTGQHHQPSSMAFYYVSATAQTFNVQDQQIVGPAILSAHEPGISHSNFEDGHGSCPMFSQAASSSIRPMIRQQAPHKHEAEFSSVLHRPKSPRACPEPAVVSETDVALSLSVHDPSEPRYEVDVLAHERMESPVRECAERHDLEFPAPNIEGERLAQGLSTMHGSIRTSTHVNSEQTGLSAVAFVAASAAPMSPLMFGSDKEPSLSESDAAVSAPLVALAEVAVHASPARTNEWHQKLGNESGQSKLASAGFQSSSSRDEEADNVVDSASENQVQNGEVTRCPCGSARNSAFMIACDRCNTWQHGKCMGIRRQGEDPEVYFCHICRPEDVRRNCIAHPQFKERTIGRDRERIKSYDPSLSSVKPLELRRLFSQDLKFRQQNNGSIVDNDELFRRYAGLYRRQFGKDRQSIIDGLAIVGRMDRLEAQDRLEVVLKRMRRSIDAHTDVSREVSETQIVDGGVHDMLLAVSSKADVKAQSGTEDDDPCKHAGELVELPREGAGCHSEIRTIKKVTNDNAIDSDLDSSRPVYVNSGINASASGADTIHPKNSTGKSSTKRSRRPATIANECGNDHGFLGSDPEASSDAANSGRHLSREDRKLFQIMQMFKKMEEKEERGRKKTRVVPAESPKSGGAGVSGVPLQSAPVVRRRKRPFSPKSGTTRKDCLPDFVTRPDPSEPEDETLAKSERGDQYIMPSSYAKDQTQAYDARISCSSEAHAIALLTGTPELCASAVDRYDLGVAEELEREPVGPGKFRQGTGIKFNQAVHNLPVAVTPCKVLTHKDRVMKFVNRTSNISAQDAGSADKNAWKVENIIVDCNPKDISICNLDTGSRLQSRTMGPDMEESVSPAQVSSENQLVPGERKLHKPDGDDMVIVVEKRSVTETDHDERPTEIDCLGERKRANEDPITGKSAPEPERPCYPDLLMTTAEKPSKQGHPLFPIEGHDIKKFLVDGVESHRPCVCETDDTPDVLPSDDCTDSLLGKTSMGTEQQRAGSGSVGESTTKLNASEMDRAQERKRKRKRERKHGHSHEVKIQDEARGTVGDEHALLLHHVHESKDGNASDMEHLRGSGSQGCRSAIILVQKAGSSAKPSNDTLPDIEWGREKDDLHNEERLSTVQPVLESTIACTGEYVCKGGLNVDNDRERKRRIKHKHKRIRKNVDPTSDMLISEPKCSDYADNLMLEDVASNKDRTNVVNIEDLDQTDIGGVQDGAADVEDVFGRCVQSGNSDDILPQEQNLVRLGSSKQNKVLGVLKNAESVSDSVLVGNSHSVCYRKVETLQRNDETAAPGGPSVFEIDRIGRADSTIVGPEGDKNHASVVNQCERNRDCDAHLEFERQTASHLRKVSSESVLEYKKTRVLDRGFVGRAGLCSREGYSLSNRAFNQSLDRHSVAIEPLQFQADDFPSNALRLKCASAGNVLQSWRHRLTSISYPDECSDQQEKVTAALPVHIHIPGPSALGSDLIPLTGRSIIEVVALLEKEAKKNELQLPTKKMWLRSRVGDLCEGNVSVLLRLPAKKFWLTRVENGAPEMSISSEKVSRDTSAVQDVCHEDHRSANTERSHEEVSVSMVVVSQRNTLPDHGRQLESSILLSTGSVCKNESHHVKNNGKSTLLDLSALDKFEFTEDVRRIIVEGRDGVRADCLKKRARFIFDSEPCTSTICGEGYRELVEISSPCAIRSSPTPSLRSTPLQVISSSLGPSCAGSDIYETAVVPPKDSTSAENVISVLSHVPSDSPDLKNGVLTTRFPHLPPGSPPLKKSCAEVRDTYSGRSLFAGTSPAAISATRPRSPNLGAPVRSDISNSSKDRTARLPSVRSAPNDDTSRIPLLSPEGRIQRRIDNHEVSSPSGRMERLYDELQSQRDSHCVIEEKKLFHYDYSRTSSSTSLSGRYEAHSKLDNGLSGTSGGVVLSRRKEHGAIVDESVKTNGLASIVLTPAALPRRPSLHVVPSEDLTGSGRTGSRSTAPLLSSRNVGKVGSDEPGTLPRFGNSVPGPTSTSSQVLGSHCTPPSADRQITGQNDAAVKSLSTQGSCSRLRSNFLRSTFPPRCYSAKDDFSKQSKDVSRREDAAGWHEDYGNGDPAAKRPGWSHDGSPRVPQTDAAGVGTQAATVAWSIFRQRNGWHRGSFSEPDGSDSCHRRGEHHD
jgi:hypothetical protein